MRNQTLDFIWNSTLVCYQLTIEITSDQLSSSQERPAAMDFQNFWHLIINLFSSHPLVFSTYLNQCFPLAHCPSMFSHSFFSAGVSPLYVPKILLLQLSYCLYSDFLIPKYKQCMSIIEG